MDPGVVVLPSVAGGDDNLAAGPDLGENPPFPTLVVCAMGGRDTLYGVIYQVVCTLCAAWEEEARVIIEPVSGGDVWRARVVAGSQTVDIAEQYKSRRSPRPWSQSEIIRTVLPDLLRAVPEASKTADALRFVTEGSAGEIEALTALRDQLRSRAPLTPDQDRLFLDIAGKLGLADEAGLRRLRVALSRLELVFDRRLEELRSEAKASLRPHLDDCSRLEQVFNSICHEILELGGRGEQLVDIRALLKRHDLSLITFRHHADVGERLSRALDGVLENRGYRPELDIGRPLAWAPQDAPIRLIVGDSGYGKTWASFAQALAVRQCGQWVVWVSATGAASTTLDAAAEVLWCDGLGRPHPPVFRHVVERYRQDTGTTGPWLTVIVDGVGLGELHDLLNVWRSDWGVSLILTGARTLVGALASHEKPRLAIAEVEAFSLRELVAYLRRRELPWADIPDDMRDILRIPILAQLYCDLERPTWQPGSEYDLVNQFWDSGVPPEHRGIVLTMAGNILLGLVRYPVSLAELPPSGPWLDVLRQKGWLRITGNTVAFCHDRLLNWAVAQAAIDLRQRGRIKDEDLRDMVVRELRPTFGPQGRAFPYLPLDALWIATRCNGTAIAVIVLRAVIQEISDKRFFRNDLAGLGLPLLEPMRAWLLDGQPPDWIDILGAMEAIAALGRRHPQAAWPLIQSLLDSDHDDLQDTGLILAAACPAPSFLDRIWSLHKSITPRRDEGEMFFRYHRCVRALAACAETDLGWLDRRPRWEGDDALEQVVHCLANIGTAAARELWSTHKTRLMERLKDRAPSCLVRCIQVFRDMNCLDILENWLSSSEEFMSGRALVALAEMAPDRLVDHLGSIEPAHTYLWRHHWIPPFLGALGNSGRTVVAELMRSRPEKFDPLVFQGQENDMDAACLDAVLADVKSVLQRNDIVDDQRRCRMVTTRLEMVARVGAPDLLDHLTSYGDSALEEALVVFGERAIAEGWHDRHHYLEQAFPVLLRFRGPGFSRLLRRALRDKNEFGTITALEWAGWCGDPGVIDELSAIATAPGGPDEAGRRIRWQASKALEALAAAGEDDHLLAGVLCNDNVVTYTLLDARRNAAPVDDRSLAPVLEALENAGPHRTRALQAVALSGRRDLIPRLQSILAAADTDSEEALFAVIALEALGDHSDEFLSLLDRQLADGQHRRITVSALLQFDTPEARQILLNDLARREERVDPVDVEVASHLVQEPQAASWLRERVARDRWLRDHANYGDLVAAGLGPDHILQDVMVDRNFDAITALAEIDRAAAIDAIERLLHEDGASVTMHEAALLLDLDPQRAEHVFRIVLSRRTAVRAQAAVGLALRLAPDLAQGFLANLLGDAGASVRHQAVLACGRQAEGFLSDRLRAMAAGDSDGEVRHAAYTALTAQRHDTMTGQLLERLRRSNAMDALRFGDALLQIGDPHALVWLRHPRSIGSAVDEQNPWLRRHLVNRLLDARKKADEKLEKQERDASKLF